MSAIGIISNLNNLGFYDVILPWLLAFSITYYLSGFIFKDDKVKAVPVIIGLITAFYLVAYTPYPTTLNSFFSNFFGEYSIASAVIIMSLMFLALLLKPGKDETVLDKLLGLLGDSNKNLQNFLKLLFNLSLIGLAIFFFMNSMGISMSFIKIGSIQISNELLSLLFFLSIIIISFIVVTKSNSGGSSEKSK